MQLHFNKAQDGSKFVQLQKKHSEILCFLTVRSEMFTAVKVTVYWDVMQW
jgi:hypothetical protein